MPNLHINIANKVATYTLRDGAVVCDNTDYTAVFTFDAEWAKEAKKVARFIWKGRHHDVDIQADGTCALPRIQGAKVIHVGVYAGELRTTTSAEIPCEGSILSKTTDPQEGYAAGYVEEIRAAVQHTDEVAQATEELLGDASSTLSRVEKEVQNLRQAIAPEYFQTDSGVAYQKTVPANALPFAEVEEVGGMTYAQDGILMHTDVVALEIQGRNILDISAALNSCLTDNGDGTYTITRNTSNDRFSAKFPLYIPVNGRIYAYVEIVTSYDGFSGAIPLQIFGEDGKTEIGAASLANNGSGFAISNGSHYARLYLNTTAPIGGSVTFRKPMIKYGTAALPFAPYIGKRSWLLPDSVRALPGYGMGINATTNNRLVWDPENGVKQYRQEVAKIRIDGTEEWGKSTAANIFQASIRLTLLAGDTKKAPAIVSNGYGFLNWYNPDAGVKPYFRIVPNGDALWIEATAEQFTEDSWKAYLAANPVEIVYPLGTPIVTDVSDILPDDNFIEVEGGGTITAMNQYGLAAPTAITYQLKEE